jgi:hypothetical protein
MSQKKIKLSGDFVSDYLDAYKMFVPRFLNKDSSFIDIGTGNLRLCTRTGDIIKHSCSTDCPLQEVNLQGGKICPISGLYYDIDEEILGTTYNDHCYPMDDDPFLPPMTIDKVAMSTTDYVKDKVKTDLVSKARAVVDDVVVCVNSDIRQDIVQATCFYFSQICSTDDIQGYTIVYHAFAFLYTVEKANPKYNLPNWPVKLIRQESLDPRVYTSSEITVACKVFKTYIDKLYKANKLKSWNESRRTWGFNPVCISKFIKKKSHKLSRVKL